MPPLRPSWPVLVTALALCAATSLTAAATAPFASQPNPLSLSDALYDPVNNRASPMLDDVPPFPTGAWWTNLVMEKGDATIVPMPYAVRVREGKLHVSHPFRVVDPSKSISSGFVAEVVLSAAPPQQKIWQHQVIGFDSFGATVDFAIDEDDAADADCSRPDCFFTAHLVRGSPFMTVEYSAATPTIESMDGVQITGFRRLDADSALDTKGQRVPFAVWR
ncbi:hypothetical protein P43SY_000563 [Pythium insidiosum]|uniref:Glycosyl hydrolase family 81 N-terminal domain-containing protein n=1 Tax=Pythium insidiosum TaxID=114742 RepID=A0AAD5L9A1_PYTIN|nr:hypothetical protein P43SY_000563 [Pythium insidiosum]